MVRRKHGRKIALALVVGALAIVGIGHGTAEAQSTDDLCPNGPSECMGVRITPAVVSPGDTVAVQAASGACPGGGPATLRYFADRSPQPGGRLAGASTPVATIPAGSILETSFTVPDGVTNDSSLGFDCQNALGGGYSNAIAFFGLADAALPAPAQAVPNASAGSGDDTALCPDGTNACSAVRADPSSTAPGQTIELRAVSGSCASDGPATVLYFPGGLTKTQPADPIGPGRTLGTVTKGSVFTQSFTVPADATGMPVFLVRCAGESDAVHGGNAFQTIVFLGGTRAGGAPFEGPHARPSLSTSVPGPSDVSTEPSLLVANLLLAAMLLLLVFPAELFNTTFEEHYDELMGWFAFRHRPTEPEAVEGEPGEPTAPVGASGGRFLGLVAVTSVLYAFLDPRVSVDAATAAMVLGVGASIALAVWVSGLVSRREVQRHHGDAGRLRLYPGALILAVVCVVISRAVDFQPGYLYGVIAGFAFTATLSKEEDGRSAAKIAGAVLAVSAVAWLLLDPVRDHLHGLHPAFPLVALEAFLASVLVGGVQGVVFSFIPLRSLPGRKVLTWSRPVWIAILGTATFAFLHLLLHPAGDVRSSLVTTIVLFLAFGAASVGFWAYFQRREEPAEPEAASEVV